jgi:hypothetical protein
LHLYMKKATDDDDATSASNDCSGSGQLVRARSMANGQWARFLYSS